MHQTPEYHVPQALALDFDRTLGDVEACVTRLYNAAGISGVSTDEIRVARAQVENDGGSFDPLTFVKNKLVDQSAEEPDLSAYERFCEHFIFDEGPSVLYEDAGRFLHMLQYSDVPHIILTYGVNPEWQRLKLAASGYTAGRSIMSHTDKGLGIEDLRARDGTFHFYVGLNGDAIYHADAMSLVDDKKSAFGSLPGDCSGFLIVRGELTPSQQGELPPGVEVIHSFDELMIDKSGVLRRRTGSDEEPPRQIQRRYVGIEPIPKNGPAIYLPLGGDGMIRRRGI